MILRQYTTLQRTPVGPYAVWESGADAPGAYEHVTVYAATMACQTNQAKIYSEGGPMPEFPIGEISLTEFTPVDDGCTCTGIPGACSVEGHGPMPEAWRVDPYRKPKADTPGTITAPMRRVGS